MPGEISAIRADCGAAAFARRRREDRRPDVRLREVGRVMLLFDRCVACSAVCHASERLLEGSGTLRLFTIDGALFEHFDLDVEPDVAGEHPELRLFVERERAVFHWKSRIRTASGICRLASVAQSLHICIVTIPP